MSVKQYNQCPGLTFIIRELKKSKLTLTFYVCFSYKKTTVFDVD